MGIIIKKLKGLFKLGGGIKRNSTKHRPKRGGRKRNSINRRTKRKVYGYSSPEAFHEAFENRWGKPGRVPWDV